MSQEDPIRTPFMPHQEELKNASSELQTPFHCAPVGDEEVQAVSKVIGSGWLSMWRTRLNVRKNSRSTSAQSMPSSFNGNGSFAPRTRSCPKAEEAVQTVRTVPHHPWLSDSEIEFIGDSLRSSTEIGP
jgi:dTDP-4-amino-4,6-dideoxygalactose transaminase